MKGYKPYKGHKDFYQFIVAVICFVLIGVIAIVTSCKADAAHEIHWNTARNYELLTQGNMYYEVLDKTHYGECQITGYDPFCKHCCGKTDGITASGKVAEIGKTVAMRNIPFGTMIYIDDLGYFRVDDRGVSDMLVDIACADHNACYAVTSTRSVYIVE